MSGNTGGGGAWIDQSLLARRPYSSVWSVSDEALLAGLAAGDAEAAAAFVRRFQGRVYGLALTIVRDPATAEDVAQETFVRVWRNADSFDPRRGRVAPWLLTVARNLAIDAARLRRSDPVDPEVLAGRIQLGGSAAAPDEIDPAPDERERLRAAIAELPADQREALVQAAYLGRTAREIGELNGVPLGTVKTRVRTAMLKLRTAMEGSHEV
jgi:RNA polymerase sigma factor (sigma-70 family)